ncbi:MAG: restriction endonuclease subunit S [Microbacterium sp.]|nr:restriction endonuclease subunit S [Microbacterium sp.]
MIDARFLALQLHSLWGQGYFQRICSNHVNQASVATRKLLETVITLPPLAEQRRIVAILEDHLSRLDAAADSLASARTRTSRFLRSLLSTLVGGNIRTGNCPTRTIVVGAQQHEFPATWTVGALVQFADSVEYGTSAKTSANSDEPVIPVLRMGNIQDGILDWASLKYLPQSHPDVLKLRLRPGDLLFNRTNSAELVGKCAVYREGDPDATFASYLIRCRFSPSVLPEWAGMVINSSFGRAYIRSVMSQQVGQANVNGTKLKAMPLPVPPVEEQRTLADVFAEAQRGVRRTIEAVTNERSKSDQLKRSLLAAAFSGRLT